MFAHIWFISLNQLQFELLRYFSISCFILTVIYILTSACSTCFLYVSIPYPDSLHLICVCQIILCLCVDDSAIFCLVVIIVVSRLGIWSHVFGPCSHFTGFRDRKADVKVSTSDLVFIHV